MASVWVDGVDELNSLAVQFEGAGERASQLIHNVLRKTAADISADAKQFVPVDTGNLKNSIGWDYHRDGDASEVEIGPTAAYGIYVEFGTSTHAPAAFMGPALDRRLPAFEAAMAIVTERAFIDG